jgi:hypothetical protein
LFDVDDVDCYLHDVRPRGAGRFNEMSNLAKDDFRLFVFTDTIISLFHAIKLTHPNLGVSWK